MILNQYHEQIAEDESSSFDESSVSEHEVQCILTKELFKGAKIKKNSTRNRVFCDDKVFLRNKEEAYVDGILKPVKTKISIIKLKRQNPRTGRMN